MNAFRISLISAALLLTASAYAAIYGSVRGVVHDPQHRPVQGAMVMLKARSSDWGKSTTTDANGEFAFNAVPIGDYSLSVVSPGFAQSEQNFMVNSSTEPVLHFALALAGVKQTVNVLSTPLEVAPADSATPTVLVDRTDVERTPGASRTNSFAMITDYVPGSYVAHDQLHIRGGHQVSWLVDGIAVPNTNIASNVGPQFDPKDIDYMEVMRGSYEADFGDRTYGVFNILPRTGFERNNEGELFLSAGNFFQTNNQVSFGSHTERFAYYASLNGNRGDLGLQTPTAQVLHDAANGYGGFSSLIFNLNPSNQLRLVTSLRKDYYQIPYDPDPNSAENQEYDSSGLRDGEHEGDAIVNFSWVHTFNPKLLLTVSPFYHYNSANYDGASTDTPSATTDDRTSNYVGGQTTFSANVARNNLQAGLYGFWQHDNQLFGLIFTPPSGNHDFRDRELASGGLTAFSLEDKVKPVSWLTLMAGMRPTHFTGGVTESTINPRFGAALTVPRLKWVFRAFYGHWYQAPPLLSASGPLLQFVNSQSLDFIKLNGERDEERQFGLTIPIRGWTLDADNFKTRATNFFDHNNVGDSNIFFPITIGQAIITGWEVTLRSPRIWHRAQVHLAYSNQVALGAGPITGGLTDFSPPAAPFALDHDQRNTLNVGGEVTLPWQTFASTNVYNGSGFTNGDAPPPYLPQHTTFDLSLGKSFGERYSLSVTALNVANRHLLMDNSLTFGGFHWNNPREIFVEFRYRFHY